MNVEVIKGLGFIFVCGLIGAYAGKLLAEKVLEAESEKDEEDYSGNISLEIEDDGKWQKMTSEEYTPKEEEGGGVTIITEPKTKEEMKKEKRKPVRDYSKFSKAKLADLAKKYEEEASAEEESVDTSKPYLITAEQYENDDQFNKAALTYYLDDVLVDEEETPVPNQEEILGPDALTRFGEKSKDPDVVYVRNEKMGPGMDYEVTRVAGNYSEIVLGLPPEDLTTKRRRNRKVTRPSEQDEEE